MTHWEPLFAVAIASVVCAVATVIVRHAAIRRRWLDHPDDNRRRHQKAVPRVGGVAVMCGLTAGVFPLALADVTVADSTLALLAGSILVCAVGLYDDLRSVLPRYKVLVQAAGALVVCAGGIHFGDSHGAAWVILGWIATTLWFLVASNGFNLIDGLDGLASGVGAATAAVVAVGAYCVGDENLLIVALALCSALVSFVCFNWSPASIFLGDSGSLTVGFMLGGMILRLYQQVPDPLIAFTGTLLLGLPLTDTALAILRRVIRRRPLFVGDRRHIHHRLLDRGWSPARAATFMIGVHSLMCLCAITPLVDPAVGFVACATLLPGAFGLLLGAARYREIRILSVRPWKLAAALRASYNPS